MKRYILRPVALSAAMLVAITPAYSASSILIWPIDPVIEFKDHAAAIWLENEGKQPTLLQLRVFAWDQRPNENHYSEQSDIIGTPPMIRIDPGKRQLIRLTRITDAPSGVERPFRVVIDEIPTPADNADNPVVGARLQMRYSIPLFVYGAGLSSPAVASSVKKGMAEQPHLGWRVTMVNGAPYLAISNTGSIHARLIKVVLQTGVTTTEVASGLLGYVLSGSTMQWALPKGAQGGGTLTALVNGSDTPQTIPAL